MESYLLRNLSELADRRAINLREEAQLWTILARDLKRQAARQKAQPAPARLWGAPAHNPHPGAKNYRSASSGLPRRRG